MKDIADELRAQERSNELPRDNLCSGAAVVIDTLRDLIVQNGRTITRLTADLQEARQEAH